MTRHIEQTVGSAVSGRLLWLSLSFCCGFGLLLASPPRFLGGAWWILPICCFVAEFLPVRIARPGWKIVFTLPFLVAIAFTAGPGTALLLDFLNSGVRFLLQSPSKSSPRIAGSNFAIAALCSTVGAVVLVALNRVDPAIQVVGYVLAYTFANMFFAKKLESPSRRVSALPYEWPSPLLISLYLLLPLATVVFSEKHLYPLVLTTFLPIIAFRKLLQIQSRSEQRRHELVNTFALMMQGCDPGTHRHLERSSRLAKKVGLRLGMSPSHAKQLETAALLHDVGKLAIDERVLTAPRKLTTHEFEHVMRHAELGEEILRNLEELKQVSRWIRSHHERVDGKGYPDGLLGDAIPIESRVISVVDAFDAMTGGIEGSDKRPYREPMSLTQAFEELDRCSGTQFDANVVTIFKEVAVGSK